MTVRPVRAFEADALAIFDIQGRGLAQQAITLAEQTYPDAVSWELCTLLEEARNCHLYEKMGYRRTGELTKLNARATLVFYKKVI